MLSILDIPLIYEGDKMQVISTLRQSIEDFKMDYLQPRFVMLAIELIIEKSEFTLSQFDAEILLYNEVRNSFDENIVKEVFRRTSFLMEIDRERKEAIENGKIMNFILENFGAPLELDPNDLDGIEYAIKEIMKRTKGKLGQEIKFKNSSDLFESRISFN